ncbi:hypothetical protein DVT68_11830 [Dyella solisilvae]|uniref:Peptidase A2 domain-containing protein n=1 Tax=Dyella solisilvae TaxID=1920168 RepID=A0A370K9P4_9GAMM|nr:hypothetical protein [Dyella solisilvae]RDI99157.1 hypothetical protein DVT68_11830 [Dyella solisilvae]
MPSVWSLIATAGLATAPSPAYEVPTVFEAGHFFATPETESGEHLKLLVDTGGGGVDGLYLLRQAVAARLKLKAGHCVFDGGDVPTATLPTYKQARGIPGPTSRCSGAMTYDDAHPISSADGLLGSSYLDGRIWTFDYPSKKLILQSEDWTPTQDLHAFTLGFQKDANGGKLRAFPRVEIRVDGQLLDMLLDTGATAAPSESGQRVTGTPTVNGFGVTSYITRSQLERWHSAHPEWRWVENGDKLFPRSGSRMIEVPLVEIAGWSVGPVWFTERPDTNFHEMMASIMDKPPEGAVGGNVLHQFVMTIDYPGGMAYFGCSLDCRVIPSASIH